MEQKFVFMKCPLCSKEVGKWGFTRYIERKFITHADDSKKIICIHCGYTTELKLNKQEVTKNANDKR